ncbi:MAG TPA: transglycosylase SLT domain-containing protein [Methylibium sp.]|nr:transglycosylase SLT domain-containing protein [Methylibium sp.]
MTALASPSLLHRLAARLLALLAFALLAAPVRAEPTGHDTVLEAREALRKKDAPRLATLRATVLAAEHPLALWVDYWALNVRLDEAKQEELDAFYKRWPGSYVEDRLRNDWLLVLGKRRDWANFRTEYPRFRMNDDREVSCHAVLARHLDGDDVGAAGRDAWWAQREPDEGCAQLAAALFGTRGLSEDDVWRKARLAVEANRARVARQAGALLGEDAAAAIGELSDNPARYLARKASARDAPGRELAALALIRLAAGDPAAAAQQMDERWDALLPAPTAAWVWASIGKQAAQKLSDDASGHFQRAAMPRRDAGPAVDLPDDTLAWKLRAALRANQGAGRWQQVVQAVNAMSATEQREPAWVYWKARALQALAADSQDGAGMVAQAKALLASIASPLHFYGKLAAEDLGQPLPLPPRPAPLTAEERAAAAANPGLTRALLLIEIGLRNEGVREWNFSLRGMGDRELLAAAQLACDREVWDRCIHTSERTQFEVDMAQRFPTPFRQDVVARARAAGLEPAYVYGLIRQESRFILDARSGVGASGLMQLMPATARWTARKLGIDYQPSRITDRDTNLQIGTGYLKLVLDSFEGSQALAAAGYNAGPNRPRKWREGPALDAAAWAENVPFAETRDYVKKVLSNATNYAALLTGEPQSLRARLGALIGPSTIPPSAEDKALP